MTLGKRIKEQRIRKGLSQSDVANYVGYSSTGHISDIENNVKKPALEKLILFCELFNVDMNYLLGFNDNSESNPNFEDLQYLISRLEKLGFLEGNKLDRNNIDKVLDVIEQILKIEKRMP